MRAKCRGAAALAVGLLFSTLAGYATAAASPPDGKVAAVPPPQGEAAKVVQNPAPVGEGEMAPPPPGREGGRRKGKGLGKDLRRLDLTPEQEAKLMEQRKEQKDIMKLIHRSLKAVHEELRAEIDRETSDPAKIEELTAEMKRLEAQRIDREIKGILQMKVVLRPEQFKKLGAIREEHKGEKGDKHGWKGKGEGRGRGKCHRHGYGDDDDEDDAGKDEYKPCAAAPQPQLTPAAAEAK